MADEQPRPAALLVMAEHTVDDPVWDRPHGHGGPVDMAALGVSEGLVLRLRAWNAQYENLALTDFRWGSPEEEMAWQRAGLHLAHDLQGELWDVEIHYFDESDRRSRPVRGRRDG